MKISNLIIIFILALIISFSLHSQSNSSHVISIVDKNETIHLEYNDGEITLLKVNGKTINESDYSNYNHIFNRYKDESHNSKSKSSVDTTTDNKTDLQSRLHRELKAYLLNNINLNLSKYEFKLTSKYIKLNGKKLSNNILDDCLDIFEKAAGHSLIKGSYFYVDISPGSSSISLSIED